MSERTFSKKENETSFVGQIKKESMISTLGRREYELFILFVILFLEDMLYFQLIIYALKLMNKLTFDDGQSPCLYINVSLLHDRLLESIFLHWYQVLVRMQLISLQ